MTKEEEMIQYCRDRLKCYITLTEQYGYSHETACKILSLYDL